MLQCNKAETLSPLPLGVAPKARSRRSHAFRLRSLCSRSLSRVGRRVQRERL